MEPTEHAMEIQIPGLNVLLRRVTLTIIFSIFLVFGTMISIIEGSLIIEEIGFFSPSALFICSSVLALVSAIILGVLFFLQELKIQVIRSETHSTPKLIKPEEEYEYHPIKNAL